jgi:hypothetical protein
MGVESMDDCGPIAIPRSTRLFVDEGQGLAVSGAADSDEFANCFGGRQSPNTRPGRPQALGLADTADYEERKHQVLRMNQAVTDLCIETSDDLTVVASVHTEDSDGSGSELSLSGDFTDEDTVPPTAC